MQHFQVRRKRGGGWGGRRQLADRESESHATSRKVVWGDFLQSRISLLSPFPSVLPLPWHVFLARETPGDEFKQPYHQPPWPQSNVKNFRKNKNTVILQRKCCHFYCSKFDTYQYFSESSKYLKMGKFGLVGAICQSSFVQVRSI